MREKQTTMFGVTEPPEGSEQWARQMVLRRVKIEEKEGALITMSEAARFLGVTPQAVADLVSRNRIRLWTFGPSRLVSFEDVREYDRLKRHNALPTGGRGKKAGLVVA